MGWGRMGNGEKKHPAEDYHGQRQSGRREQTRGVGAAGARRSVCAQEAWRDEEGNAGGDVTLE